MPRPKSLLSRLLIGLLLAGIAVGVLVYADWRNAAPRDALAQATYVGGNSCIECHQQQHDEWVGSHHDRAMETATDESVLGDFNNAQFERFGVTTRFFRDGKKYMVNTEGPDGEMHDYEVKYTFGLTPLQQYMVEFPDGRVQVLRESWDTNKKEWFYVTPPDVTDERIEPGDPLHWTGIAQNWNTTCAECHSTNLEKNYDLATNTYHTTFSEIDVSCEECHGPGSLHVELARANSLFWDRRHRYGLAKLKSLDSTSEIETCAKCHSFRHGVHPGFRPTSPLLDSYEPSLLRESFYHADGQIEGEVYVYGSFLQSKMHAQGVRCTNCHNPHSLKVKFEGNALCAQCHVPEKYDTPAHHHHKPGTPGASCVECHMPETTYMVVDPRRDHSIRIPRPDLTVSLGTPNACNKCHTVPNEDAQWAADAVMKWYGPKRRDDPHWAPAFAAGRAGAPEGETLLAELYRRKTAPAIVRATAIELLAQYPGAKSAAVRREALGAPESLIRLAAVRSAQAQDPRELLKDLSPRLNDPVRSVRIEAARRLVEFPAEALTPEQLNARKLALDEFREAQEIQSDHAAGHMNLGSLAMQQGDPQTAAAEFRHAIRLEPYLAGPRSSLAEIINLGQEDPEEADRLNKEEVKLLQRDVKLAPGNAALWYELGRLLVLTEQYDEAPDAFTKAAELAPSDYRIRLMHALSLEKRYAMNHEQKDFDDAVASLRKLEALNPASPDAKGILRRLLDSRRATEPTKP